MAPFLSCTGIDLLEGGGGGEKGCTPLLDLAKWGGDSEVVRMTREAKCYHCLSLDLSLCDLLS